VVKDRGAYHVGPMARYNLNFDKLTPLAQKAALSPAWEGNAKILSKALLSGRWNWFLPARKPFALSKITKCLSDLYRCSPKAGIGHGATEAPRGLLYHRYEIDDDGVIKTARIIAPTSQNQKVIENDLAALCP
jgi:sulfhydrogenase subunit alpha